MKAFNPLVSVITPFFNRADFLEETILSVMNQTYTNWELCLIDDGSDDFTVRIVESFCLKDKRVKLFKREGNSKGVSRCRNIGIEESQGAFYVFLDSDDILVNSCIQNRIDTISVNPEYDFWVFPTGHFIKEPGDSNKKWNLLNKNDPDLVRFIKHDNPWQTAGPIWGKSSISLLKAFNERYSIWEDWEFHIRALISNLKYYKSSDDNVDNYYRRDFSTSSNSLTTEGDSYSNTINRIKIAQETYCSIKDYLGKSEIDAFGVTFFRLLVSSKKNTTFQNKCSLLFFCWQNHIFTLLETLTLAVFFCDIKIFNTTKNVYSLKLLHILSSYKFNNRDNVTYIFFNK
jgi:glycosyltransferase involved in cell wall biosynthesis